MFFVFSDCYNNNAAVEKHIGRYDMKQDILVEQEEKRKSELDALQSQINPHFYITRWIPLYG